MMPISVKAFREWGFTVPKWSRWWVEDEQFETLLCLLAVDQQWWPGESLLPVFSITWRGVVTLHRKSDYLQTRFMEGDR